MLKKLKPPPELAGCSFLSGKAGSFSDTPQRTVQKWTDDNLIIPPSGEPNGTGDRRQYSVLNCIEIGIIKSLAKDRVSFRVISEVMKTLREGRPLTFEEALADDKAFLIIRFYEPDKHEISCVSNEHWGSQAGIENETRDFQTFWIDTTIPKDDQFQKSMVVDLSYIARKILDKMLEQK